MWEPSFADPPLRWTRPLPEIRPQVPIVCPSPAGSSVPDNKLAGCTPARVQETSRVPGGLVLGGDAYYAGAMRPPAYTPKLMEATARQLVRHRHAQLASVAL